jgi:ComF family protein
VCRQGSAAALCVDCDRLYRPPRLRCARCALPVTDGGPCLRCRQGPPPQARTWVGVDYAFPWDGLIRRWKFHGHTGLTGLLAAPLAESLAQRPVDGAAPLLVPVPLSPARLRERGFNQAALLSRALGRQLGWPCADGLLVRPVERAQQAGLTRAQRQRNLHGAFMVAPQHRAALGTRPLVLVDDVLTTGETAAEAVRTLLNAGAQAVDVAAIARTA